MAPSGSTPCGSLSPPGILVQAKLLRHFGDCANSSCGYPTPGVPTASIVSDLGYPPPTTAPNKLSADSRSVSTLPAASSPLTAYNPCSCYVADDPLTASHVSGSPHLSLPSSCYPPPMGQSLSRFAAILSILGATLEGVGHQDFRPGQVPGHLSLTLTASRRNRATAALYGRARHRQPAAHQDAQDSGDRLDRSGRRGGHHVPEDRRGRGDGERRDRGYLPAVQHRGCGQARAVDAAGRRVRAQASPPIRRLRCGASRRCGGRAGVSCRCWWSSTAG